MLSPLPSPSPSPSPAHYPPSSPPTTLRPRHGHLPVPAPDLPRPYPLPLGERIPTPKQPADPSLLRLLLSQAKPSSLSSSSGAARVTAVRRLWELARESEKNRAAMATREMSSAMVEIAFEEAGIWIWRRR
uniref:Uncharacterized protein n=1 Tax=Ananas comosus var. bracteatus TaxID=296719 RepID=A0A6V7NIJ9_ANACO|nr:unnamed protein product [Ananas comosus var. bracteatus]